MYFRAPRFRGYQQQDSQELLRYLLDSLRMEEVKVIQVYVFEIWYMVGSKSCYAWCITHIRTPENKALHPGFFWCWKKHESSE